MKCLMIMLVLTLSFPIHSKDDASPVNSIRNERKAKDWYTGQANLWQERVNNNLHDPSAWRYYYLATCYSGQSTIDIIQKMAKYVPNSYEYLYLSNYQKGASGYDTAIMDQALKLKPNSAEILLQYLIHSEVTGNMSDLAEYAGRLYKLDFLNSAVLDYNYNLLVSTKPNAIVFTMDDMDTYPGFILQQAVGIRKDVNVINSSLIYIYEYLDHKLKASRVISNPFP
jgi:hypothetical protein